jgi:hypothetical protein
MVMCTASADAFSASQFGFAMLLNFAHRCSDLDLHLRIRCPLFVKKPTSKHSHPITFMKIFINRRHALETVPFFLVENELMQRQAEDVKDSHRLHEKFEMVLPPGGVGADTKRGDTRRQCLCSSATF